MVATIREWFGQVGDQAQKSYDYATTRGTPKQKARPALTRISDLWSSAELQEVSAEERQASMCENLARLIGHLGGHFVGHARAEHNQLNAVCWVTTYLASRLMHKNVTFYSTLLFTTLGIIHKDQRLANLLVETSPTFKGIQDFAEKAADTGEWFQTQVARQPILTPAITLFTVVLAIMKSTSGSHNANWPLTASASLLVGGIAGLYLSTDPYREAPA